MFSYWGTGIRLYGSRDKDPNDGSYIATKWITIFFFPIIPLGSYRVWKIDEKINASPVWVHTKKEFRMVQVKWNWKQILKTYLVGILIVAFLMLTELLFEFPFPQ